MLILRLALSDTANAARSAVYPTCNEWPTSVKHVPCQNHESHAHRANQRAVTNASPESFGFTKSSTRSIRALNRCWASCRNWKTSLWRYQPWKALRVTVEENRAEVNFELVERLAECEERD
jgi:hypothetical protein